MMYESAYYRERIVESRYAIPCYNERIRHLRICKSAIRRFDSDRRLSENRPSRHSPRRGAAFPAHSTRAVVDPTHTSSHREA
jgi:hypothetical protein